MIRALLFNGQPQAPDLAWHRGFQYGDGVFRTCLIYESQPIDIEKQVKKAMDDARRLGLEPADAGVLAAEAARLAQGQSHAVLKLFLIRSSAERGYRATTTAADRLWCRFEAPAWPAACWERGVRAARVDFRLASQPALAGIKHLNRLEQVLAGRDWPAGADEALVADAAGRPACGTRTNLFWVARGALRTPDLADCGVAGVMRDKVLAAATATGLRVDLAPGSWAELAGADEAFVTNSVIGIWPLASLDGHAWAAPGPVTRQLMGQLRHPRLVRH
jgi:4-amino-4-deoxychorismate lyase